MLRSSILGELVGSNVYIGEIVLYEEGSMTEIVVERYYQKKPLGKPVLVSKSLWTDNKALLSFIKNTKSNETKIDMLGAM